MSQLTRCIHIELARGAALPLDPLATGRAWLQRPAVVRLAADLLRVALLARTAAVLVVVDAGRVGPDVAVRP